MDEYSESTKVGEDVRRERAKGRNKEEACVDYEEALDNLVERYNSLVTEHRHLRQEYDDYKFSVGKAFDSEEEVVVVKKNDYDAMVYDLAVLKKEAVQRESAIEELEEALVRADYVRARYAEFVNSFADICANEVVTMRTKGIDISM